MIVDIPAVVRDGSLPPGTVPPALPTSLTILWPQAEDGTLRLTVTRQDLTAFDLSGCAIVFAVRRYANDPVPEISREATIIDAAMGRADVILVAADTLLLDTLPYAYDLQLTDPFGKRWQVVPRSVFSIDPVIAQLGDSVSVPITTSPLALGPSWLEFSEASERGTDLTTAEQIPGGGVLQIVWDFDDGTADLVNLFARLCALARVTGGIGTVRVRYGGTPGQPDGTLLLTSDPITGTSYAAITKAVTVTKPTGVQLLKVTLQNDTAGQGTYLSAVSLRARGAI